VTASGASRRRRQRASPAAGAARRAGSPAVFRRADESQPLIERVRRSVIGDDAVIDGPFGPRRLVYADATASGRSLSFIEDAIRARVLPLYANTHTEASATGRHTTALREDARRTIHRAVNGTADDVVVFCGSGSTAATFLDRLKLAGINLVSFNPVNPLEAKVPYSFNDRDHRKILAVDGKIAIIGGVNLSTAYQSNPIGKSGGPPGSTPDQWRDTDLQIEGPAVAELQKLFLDHWTKQKGPTLDQSAMFPTVAPKGNAVVRVLGSTPDNEIPLYYVTLLTAIRTAEKSVKITTAYFAPTRQEMEALTQAAKRGVDISLMLPARSDSPLSIAVAHARYSELLDAGVKIYELHGVVLHSKTIVVDGVWLAIGSSNFDHRSVIFNDEVDVVVLGSDAAQELEDLFRADQAAADLIEIRAWKSRPMWVQLREIYSLAWENLL